MDNQLKLLISLYEEEGVRLQALINECLQESEFLMAHYHSNALFQLNQKLYTLKSIDDKYFNQKNFLQLEIGRWQQELDAEPIEALKEHYRKNLHRLISEIEKLDMESGYPGTAGNEHDLDEVISKLLQGKIKNLKLILKRSCNLYFDIIYAERKLNLVLKQIKLHIKNGVLNEQQVKSFTQLGFVSSANNTKLILQFNGEKSKMHAECKLVLSKLVFEVFRFTSFENDSYISFTEKKGR